MKWVYDDGGREAAGFKGTTGDCVVRSIAIVTGILYIDVYNEINNLAKDEHVGKRKTKKSSSRTGVFRETYTKYLENAGLKWVPTMFVGSGCHVHLKDSELPSGNLIVRISKHITAIKDGVLYDTYDCSRNGTRCVYGYWQATKLEGNLIRTNVLSK